MRGRCQTLNLPNTVQVKVPSSQSFALQSVALASHIDPATTETAIMDHPAITVVFRSLAIVLGISTEK
jgi:hypothetical protein